MSIKNNWFKIDRIDNDTFVISEPNHWEETNCYLLLGGEKVLLIDTGLGIAEIYDEIRKLTDKPIIAVPTHIHWDHIGGLKNFNEFYVHNAEEKWICQKFPLPIEIVRNEVVKGNALPDDFDVNLYEIFQGIPKRLLSDGDEIDIGGRMLTVLHTPGHSPGHICLFEENRGYLFTGDLVYEGTLFANYPSTDPKAYLDSLEKICKLTVNKIFPGHHRTGLSPKIMFEMRDELRKLDSKDLLSHSFGKFSYENWEIML